MVGELDAVHDHVGARERLAQGQRVAGKGLDAAPRGRPTGRAAPGSRVVTTISSPPRSSSRFTTSLPMKPVPPGDTTIVAWTSARSLTNALILGCACGARWSWRTTPTSSSWSRSTCPTKGSRWTASATAARRCSACARRAYDLLILDLQLPGLDGLSLCAAAPPRGQRARRARRDAHRARRRDRPHRGPGDGRRRLRGEAVLAQGAGGPGARAVPPPGARPRRRRRRGPALRRPRGGHRPPRRALGGRGRPPDRQGVRAAGGPARGARARVVAAAAPRGRLGLLVRRRAPAPSTCTCAACARRSPASPRPSSPSSRSATGWRAARTPDARPADTHRGHRGRRHRRRAPGRVPPRRARGARALHRGEPRDAAGGSGAHGAVRGGAAGGGRGPRAAGSHRRRRRPRSARAGGSRSWPPTAGSWPIPRPPAPQLAALENHSSRPEVAQAIAYGRGSDIRRSATVGDDLLYVAVAIRRGGRLLGVSRVARPRRPPGAGGRAAAPLDRAGRWPSRSSSPRSSPSRCPRRWRGRCARSWTPRAASPPATSRRARGSTARTRWASWRGS